MKGTNLGEFEELVLLLIRPHKGKAYCIRIKEELSLHAGRSISLGAIHSTLSRLEKKGFINSKMGDQRRQRGQRRKRLYTLTQSGLTAVSKAKELRDTLWDRCD